jgi:hypothetical protein
MPSYLQRVVARLDPIHNAPATIEGSQPESTAEAGVPNVPLPGDIFDPLADVDEEAFAAPAAPVQPSAAPPPLSQREPSRDDDGFQTDAAPAPVITPGVESPPPPISTPEVDPKTITNVEIPPTNWTPELSVPPAQAFDAAAPDMQPEPIPIPKTEPLERSFPELSLADVPESWTATADVPPAPPLPDVRAGVDETPAQTIDLATLMRALYPPQEPPAPDDWEVPAAPAPVGLTDSPPQVTIGEIHVEVVTDPERRQRPVTALPAPRSPSPPAPRPGVRSKRGYGIGQM